VSTISGVLLFLAFPGHDFSLLAWVALVPLLLQLSFCQPLQGFFSSFLCGLFFFLGIFKWTLTVPGYTYLHHLLLITYLSLYFAVFGLLFAMISRRFGVVTALFSAPFTWIVLEYARSNLSFLALPWGLLAHSQYDFIQAIQIASIAGTYGVSFLIVLCNTLIAAVSLYFLTKCKHTKGHSSISKDKLTPLIFFTTIIIGFSFIYGYYISDKELDGRKIKISLVQPNIEQDKKWDTKYAKTIENTLMDFTSKVVRDHPSLIVWPETVTPNAISQDKLMYRKIKRKAISSGAYILLGSAQVQKFVREKKQERIVMNSAYLISPDARETEPQRYDKIRLFPFGEYLPAKDIIPWSLINVKETNTFFPGKEFTLFDFPEGKFAVTICWENLFADHVRQYVRQGARFIVNLTNEAWFGDTDAPSQFLSMNVFRAVENRIFVVRCGNTGISCFIDPYGQVVDSVKNAQGHEVFVAGTLTGAVVAMKSETFYTRYGDWIVWLSGALTVFLLLIAIKKDLMTPAVRSKKQLEQL